MILDQVHALEIELREDCDPNVVGTYDKVVMLVVSSGQCIYKAVVVWDDVVAPEFCRIGRE